MRLIKLLLRHSPGLVTLAVLCGVLSGGAFAALVALLNQALTGDPARREGLGLRFAAVAALALAARVASQSLLAWLRHRALLDLRGTLARRVLASPLRALEEHGPHLILGTMMEGVVTASNGLMVLPFIFTNVVVILASLSYLAWLSPRTLGLMLLCIAAALATYWAPTRHAVRLLRRGRDLQDGLYRHFQSLVHGIKELKLHRARREALLDDCLLPAADAMQRAQMRGQILFSATSAWGLLLFFVILGLLVFAYPRYAAVSPATLTGYALATLYMQQPFQLIMDLIPALGQGEVAMQKIESLGLALGSSAPEESPTRDEPAPPPTFHTLELVDVTHTYRRENEEGGFVLGPIKLAIGRGESVFLVGGNGSGKTTLAKLITGLYTPESGRILIDGRPVTDETLDDYRTHFSAVFADFHLFDALLGLTPAQQAPRIKHYLSRLLLDRKVQLLGGALSTTALSQGQRKRLALLTAYLEDRPIYLFDEWAADQDPQFKDIFYRELLPELKSQRKTVIAITHDERYFHLADRVLKLEDGRLVAAPPGPAGD